MCPVPRRGPREGEAIVPKERIYGRQGGDECDISLQWEKSQVWHDRDDDQGAGYVTLALVQQFQKDGEQDEQVVGYAQLDRTACNRLVEKVRRARTAAYGKDE